MLKKNFKSEGLKWFNLRMNFIWLCFFVIFFVDKVFVKMLVDIGVFVSIIFENVIKWFNLDMFLILKENVDFIIVDGSCLKMIG